MSRWKYRAETITVGDNVVTVRELTAGERAEFMKLHKATKETGGSPLEVQAKVLRWAITMPPDLTDEDVNAMPPELSDKAIETVLRLSGLATAEVDEKKDAPAQD